MTVALIILLAVGAVALIRAGIVGESPVGWIGSLVRGGE